MWAWLKWVNKVKRYKHPVIKCHEDVMYSMVTKVNNTVLYAGNLLKELISGALTMKKGNF